MSKKIILSGVKPTNQITLGNYLGALKNWVKLQKDYECFFPVVDLHAITVKQDPKGLRESTYFATANYIASGIDPEQCVLFVQSHVPQHAELAWVMNCFSYMGELNRMTQFKEKSDAAGKNIPAGIFSYPTLMAADILLYQAHLVPIGADQKQHLELTRNLATRINNLYKEDVFQVPEAYIPPVGARIMDLQDPLSKMGKSTSSEKGAVYLGDSEKETLNKVKIAVTDSLEKVSYSDEQPGVKNLLTIQAAITGKSFDDIVSQYEGKGYGHLKVETGELINEELKPIRKKVAELLEDKAYLEKVLKKGAEIAQAKAQQTLDKVYDVIGFLKS